MNFTNATPTCAHLHCLDLGYETTDTAPVSSSALSHSRLASVVSLGASVALTFYHLPEAET
ncbi:MAG: hypothetical protein EOP84_08300 [Verrucomicrobiaceae bacterium]|nr:MAG: hypothetical protein EOP84_08300 [Verrucomicrobiaceae bacterium]